MDIQERYIFRRKVRVSLFMPLLLIFIMWMVAIVEALFNLSFYKFGVIPRDLIHSYNIFFATFIHKDWLHLWANTIPIFMLSWGLFFFYREIAYKVFLQMYIGSALLLWIIGRNAFHIGSSGLIYALASFLFMSGIIQKNYRLMAISLIVSFIYGSMIWGIIPTVTDISWEGHLSGLFIGFVLAVLYRNKGPVIPTHNFDSDEDESIPEEIWNEDFLSKRKEQEDLHIESYSRSNDATSSLWELKRNKRPLSTL